MRLLSLLRCSATTLFAATLLLTQGSSVSMATPATPAAKTVLSLSDPTASLAARLSSASADQQKLVFSVSAPSVSDISVITLTDPGRVVIDVPGMYMRKQYVTPLGKNPLVSRVRTGIHKDKVRFVLDLVNNTVPNHTWSLTDEGFEVTMLSTPTAVASARSLADSLPAVSVSSDENTTVDASAQNEANNQDSLTTAQLNQESLGERPLPAEIKTESTDNGSTQLALMNKKTATISNSLPRVTAPVKAVRKIPTPLRPETARKPAPKLPSSPRASLRSLQLGTEEAPDWEFNEPIHLPTNEQVLHRIIFQKKSDTTPELFLALTKRASFRLSRAHPTEYRLTIPQSVAFADRLLLPHFPPQEFAGLTLVKASETVQGLSIRLGVIRGTRLRAYAKKGGIGLVVEER